MEVSYWKLFAFMVYSPVESNSVEKEGGILITAAAADWKGHESRAGRWKANSVTSAHVHYPPTVNGLRRNPGSFSPPILSYQPFYPQRKINSNSKSKSKSNYKLNVDHVQIINNIKQVFFFLCVEKYQE